MQKANMTSRPAATACNVFFSFYPLFNKTIRRHAHSFYEDSGKEHDPITIAKLIKSRKKDSSHPEILHDRPSDTANEKPRMLSPPRRKIRSDTTKAAAGVLTA